MIELTYGSTRITVDPVIDVRQNNRTIENYDGRDLAAAVNAVVRALNVAPQSFEKMMREDRRDNYDAITDMVGQLANRGGVTVKVDGVLHEVRALMADAGATPCVSLDGLALLLRSL